MDQMVNNMQLTWKLAWLLKTYRTCTSTVIFSKYEFYNKILGGVILPRVTSGVTWIQPNYIYIYIYWNSETSKCKIHHPQTIGK